MTQYADEALTIKVNGYDVSEADGIHITFSQPSALVSPLDITDVEISGNSVVVALSQIQTGKFNPDLPLQIQANFFANGKRTASDIAKIPVKSNLLRRIIDA